MMRSIFCLLIGLGLATHAHAQRPDFTRPGFGGNSSTMMQPGGGAPTGNDDFRIIYPDSVPLHYYHAHAPQRLYAHDDTLLQGFQQFDPTRQGDGFYRLALGDIGQPVRPLFYTPQDRVGARLGLLEAYDLYLWQPQSIRYFRNPKAYTEAQYTQSGSQNEFTLDALAALPSPKGWHVTADFRRIRQDGSYPRQALKYGNFSIAAAYQSADKQHQAFLSFLTNNLFAESNGGLADPTAIGQGGQFASRSQLAVRLSAAQTEVKQQHFSVTNHLALLRTGRDSTGLRVSHQLTYGVTTFKYADTAPPADSAVYGAFNVDERGLRQFMRLTQLGNRASVTLNYLGRLEAGLDHTLQLVLQEPTDSTFNTLFAYGKWQLATPNERLGLDATARFGLLRLAGDYQLSARAFLDWAGVGRLSGQLMQQRYTPSLLQHRAYVSQQRVWQRDDFNKPIETSLTARLDIERTHTQLIVSNHLITQPLYWDSLALPLQLDGTQNIFQIAVQQDFHARRWHLLNRVGWQQVAQSDVLHLPRWIGQHSLYWEGGVFKSAATVRIGLDARWHSAYLADAFQPLTGQFHLQYAQTITNWPIVDAYLSAKVKTFRGFVKVENLNELAFSPTTEALIDEQFPSWNFNPPYYSLTAPQYAMRTWGIRFGVHWRFYD